MVPRSKVEFVGQQGFDAIRENERAAIYRSLMFQPKVVALFVAAGLVLQSPAVFLTLSAALFWNALAPSRNVFDALYNAVVAKPRGLPLLGAAPLPRRFAQGIAATFMLAIGVFLLSGWSRGAWMVEGALVIALAALLLGRFCFGAWFFHLLEIFSRPRRHSAIGD